MTIENNPGVPLGGLQTIGQIDATNPLSFEATRNGMAVALDLLSTHTAGGPVVDDHGTYLGFINEADVMHALDQGKRVAPGVHLYLQFGSQKIKQYARRKGYLEIFEKAGAELIDPSCGACINAGPGASKTAETVTVSAQNRNFPGRSGPGKLYLASP